MSPMQKMNQKSGIRVLFSFVFLLIIIILMPLIGSQSLHWQNIYDYLKGMQTPDGVIFFQIRLPRVLLAVLVGSSLSVAGVVLQALLRNPLATPYTLGISSGGALGAVLAIKAGFVLNVWGFSSVQISAFSGSLITIWIVYLLARQPHKISVHTLILAGVTISYFFAALILIVHYISDFTETHQMIRWMIGGLDIVNYRILINSLPMILVSLLILLALARPFNILSTSEETALSKGVDVPRIQKIAFLFASLLTGSVVALSGPIGFVGLIIPHLMRLTTGPDHRYLLPASLFFGGAFLALADTIARTIFAPIDLPVGIITAIIGGPFFLWLLVRSR